MKVMNLFVLIFLCASVSAISGVNPRSYEIDFVPDYEGEFVFDFIIEEGVSASLSVEGDLLEYVKLDKGKVSGSESVVASLSLPSEISTPGMNYVKIVANKGDVNVVGIIKVNVPYPKEYIELDLVAPNANVGEVVKIVLDVSNLGSKFVFAIPSIGIYSDDGLVDNFKLEGFHILEGNSKEFRVFLNTTGYPVDNYSVVAFVEYGEQVARAENPFKLGELLVGVSDYTDKFIENKINSFEIVVESFWNNDIEEIYAEVEIPEFKDVKFVTNAVELDAWKTITLTGFFDTTMVSGYKMDAEITLHYENKSNVKNVEFKIVRGVDYIFYIVVASILIIIGLLVWRALVFVKKIKKP